MVGLLHENILAMKIFLITVIQAAVEYFKTQTQCNACPVQIQCKCNACPVQIQCKCNASPMRTQSKPNTNATQTQRKCNTNPMQVQCTPKLNIIYSQWEQKGNFSMTATVYSIVFLSFNLCSMPIQIFLMYVTRTACLLLGGILVLGRWNWVWVSALLLSSSSSAKSSFRCRYLK